MSPRLYEIFFEALQSGLKKFVPEPWRRMGAGDEWAKILFWTIWR